MSNPRWQDGGMIEMVNGSLMRVEPSGAWNQCGERGVEGESLGRSGIRPYRALGDLVATGKSRVGRRVHLGKGGKIGTKSPGSSRLFPAFPTFSHVFPP